MKHYLITALAILVVSFGGVAQGQSDLIPKTNAQKIAEQINDEQLQSAKFLGSQLVRWYRAVNTEGEQQNILDVYGTNASKILARYIAFRTVIVAEYPDLAAQIPEADVAVFVANQDGTVTYVAPPEPAE